MKKILSLFLTMFLIFPIRTFAINIDPKIECNSVNLKAGEKTECDFYLNVSDGKISAISASYSFDSQVSMIKVENAENWQGNADGNQIDYYDFRDYTNHVPIAKFTYKVKENISLDESTNSSLKINVIEVADEYGNANILNYPVEVKFNLIKGSVVTTTTKPVTTTTPVITSSTSQKKNTTTIKTTKKSSNSTTTKQQESNIEDIKTTSTNISDNNIIVTTKKTTIIKTTFNNIQKEQKNPIIIVSLLLFLILLIIAIIIIIKEEQKRKENESSDV